MDAKCNKQIKYNKILILKCNGYAIFENVKWSIGKKIILIII